MYLYKAFDICFKSEILIPQFISTENQKVDVSIKYGNVKDLLPVDKRYDHLFQRKEGEVFFYWDKIGWFLVQNGNEILVDPLPDAEDKLIYLPVIGILLAVLLQQRGNLVLHASAVSINHEAVIFVGWKGQGKSTTAAILYERGHPMISDDIVLVKNKEHGVPSVIPGFPHFKLMPEVVSMVLAEDPEKLSEVYTGAEKRYRSSSDNFLQTSIPLKAIYLLDEGPEIQVHRLKVQEAISELIANTYSARYGKQLLENDQGIANFRQCSNVINQIPIYRLERPKSFHLMNNFAEFIESHCKSTADVS